MILEKRNRKGGPWDFVSLRGVPVLASAGPQACELSSPLCRASPDLAGVSSAEVCPSSPAVPRLVEPSQPFRTVVRVWPGCPRDSPRPSEVAGALARATQALMLPALPGEAQDDPWAQALVWSKTLAGRGAGDSLGRPGLASPPWVSFSGGEWFGLGRQRVKGRGGGAMALP